MSEPPADQSHPEPVRPAAPRRVVADWEYRTAYDQGFQIRLPPDLHDRLSGWAKQERRSLSGLVIEILEEAVRRRGGGHG